MSEGIEIAINGKALTVDAGTTVSAAILLAEVPCRLSVTGEPRTAFCGMGICFECRAIVNGIAQQRTCQTLCDNGMTVETMR
jgi:hypothetical protein